MNKYTSRIVEFYLSILQSTLIFDRIIVIREVVVVTMMYQSSVEPPLDVLCTDAT